MNKIQLTPEYIKYLEQALAFAVKHGFKVKVFNENGEIIGLQG